MLLKRFLIPTIRTLTGSIAAIAIPQLAAAAEQTTEAASAPVDQYQLMRYILLAFAILFLMIILVLANAVASAGKIYWEREKEKAAAKNRILTLLPWLLTGLLLGGNAHAQDAAIAEEAVKTPHMPYDLYVFIVVVALEFTIIMVLAGLLLKFLKVKPETALKPVKNVSFKKIFQKVNQTVAIEDEAQLDLNHDYDGIRELDNKVPAWWQFAFYATIIFGAVYIYRMFVTGSLPDQMIELQTANQIAAVQKAAYLKHAANNVDENSVKMLDAAGIAEGAALFSKNCQACHGDKGQGGVGPNLTDEYWLHEGSIRDIFHSIKYGWPEKGMKSWEGDFSPAQIAQLASYVKSLHGTNPPGGKEPQGNLFKETAAVATADTTQKDL